MTEKHSGTAAPGDGLVHNEDLPSVNHNLGVVHLVAPEDAAADDGAVG